MVSELLADHAHFPSYARRLLKQTKILTYRKKLILSLDLFPIVSNVFENNIYLRVVENMFQNVLCLFFRLLSFIFIYVYHLEKPLEFVYLPQMDIQFNICSDYLNCAAMTKQGASSCLFLKIICGTKNSQGKKFIIARLFTIKGFCFYVMN